MRREAGHTFLANAIWTIGLPRLPSCYRADGHFLVQPHAQLSDQILAAISEAIHKVLEWLDRVAQALLNHRTTAEYREALRKSGVAKGQPGLSATEQETRAAARKARYDMRTARRLVLQWHTGTRTWETSYRWERSLLEAYWNGSLDARLREVTSADTLCRTPSFAMASAPEQTASQWSL